MLKYLILISFIPVLNWVIKIEGRDNLILTNSKDLKSDFIYFRTVMEKAHPSLYRYISKKSLDSLFESSFDRLDSLKSQNEFWEIIQFIAVKIGCGHTSVGPSITSLADAQQKQVPVIPFYVNIKNNRIYINRYIQSPQNNGYRIGDEIISINGELSEKILSRIKHLVASDGLSDSYRNYRMEIGEFNLIFSMLYESKGQFDFVFQRKGSYKNVSIKSNVTRGNFKSHTQTVALQQKLTYPSNLENTAILKLRNFNEKSFLGYYSEIFQELERMEVKSLIIDLRNSSGGRSDAPIELLKYLSPIRFRFSTITEGKIKDFEDFSQLFTKTQAPSLEALRQIRDNKYMAEFQGNNFYEPYSTGRFKGKIFVFTNGGTFSSSALFAIALKYQCGGIVLGTETGGGSWGCNGGKVTFITLPKTGLRIQFPLMWTNSVDPKPRKGLGLFPDHEVYWDSMKIDAAAYENFDPFLKKVSELIN